MSKIGSVATDSSPCPAILQDPRFVAGRSLIQQGLAGDGAIDIFSTLVEECIAKYGESSIETSPAFFEYGNALLRAFNSSSAAEDEDQATDHAADSNQETDATENNKPAHPQQATKAATAKEKDGNAKEEENDDDDGEGETDDLDLALEMMENAFSILDEYHESHSSKANGQNGYGEWELEQRPRVLLGIGDCLSALGRHADAADAYSRVLELQQTALATHKGTGKEDTTLLKAHRRVCEATVLIAEEILACPEGEDIRTSETGSLIVKADERIEYARGYYDKARDALQETVFFLGKLASKNLDLGTEKEDVCFLATMVMGVGEALAQIDETQGDQSAEPTKKKLKTG